MDNKKIEDVGFSTPTQRGQGQRQARKLPAPGETSLEPWEDVIDAASGAGKERWSLDRETSETRQPLRQPPRPAPPLKPIPARPPEEITAPQLNPSADGWPAGRTRPLQPIAKPQPSPQPSPQHQHQHQAYRGARPLANDLLENAPVSSRLPPVTPVSQEEPANDETRLGALLNPKVNQSPESMRPIPEPARTVAAPGELAGMLPEELRRPSFDPMEDHLSFDDFSIDEAPPKPIAPSNHQSSQDLANDLRGPAALRPRMPIPPAGTEPLPSESILHEEIDPAARLRVPPVKTELELDQISDERPRGAIPPEPTHAMGLEDSGQLSMPGGAVPLVSPVLSVSETGERPLIFPNEPTPMGPLARHDTRSVEIKRPSPGSQPEKQAPAELSWTLASGSRRFWALVIDGVVVAAIIFAPMMLGLFGENIAKAPLYDPDDLSQLLVQGDLTIPLICFFLVMFTASALGHALGGRSLGKLLLGLEVVQKRTGERPSKGRAALRSALSLLSFCLGGLGYFWLLIDRRARTLHDLLTGTMVVRSSSRQQVAAGRAQTAAQGAQFANEPTL